MQSQHNNHYNRDEVVSYSKLRAFIGIIGIALPIMVFLGCFFTGAQKASLQESISHYYYSKMHIVFTGTLCVLGGFLITYQGKDKWESRLSNLAGASAFGIAAFPTTINAFILSTDKQNLYLEIVNPVTKGWGNIHFAFAGLLFFCFVIFCFYFFQKPDNPDQDINEVKFKRRRKIYTICGWTIIVSIILIAVFAIWPSLSQGIFQYSTFIFETTSLWAFGTAWLVKGSKSLKQLPVIKKMVAPVR